MKKTLAAAAISISLAALLLIGAFLALFALAGGRNTDGHTVRLETAETYINEHWAPYSYRSYDENTGALTIGVSTTMDYQQACSFGGSIYTQELALEDYAPILRQILAGARTACSVQPLLVILEGISTDQQTIFTVTSSGEVWHCWEAG